ncbi:hypothetical protein JTE90_001882 [Oedothorax gibbosus]|uniref:Uncharacterized protein n=1 Tax=Oedothorax gibbosus TaxID=931172 RepID=A0AAV6VQN0_9ARAC|nr:hypothetical protein JTE90_001882 [Oedothorax gibbosus]
MKPSASTSGIRIKSLACLSVALPLNSDIYKRLSCCAALQPGASCMPSVSMRLSKAFTWVTKEELRNVRIGATRIRPRTATLESRDREGKTVLSVLRLPS